MAFLHCHGCNNWGQDGFWSKEDYNPFRQDIIDHLKECLFKDEIVTDPVTGYGTISGTEFVARQLEQLAASIRNMQVKTDEDWKRVRDTWRCPECGSDDWGID